jgi:hypothetical protein
MTDFTGRRPFCAAGEPGGRESRSRVERGGGVSRRRMRERGTAADLLRRAGGGYPAAASPAEPGSEPVPDVQNDAEERSRLRRRGLMSGRGQIDWNWRATHATLPEPGMSVRGCGSARIQADEIAGLDTTLSRGADRSGLVFVGQIVIPCKQQDPGVAPGSRLLDRGENRAAGDKRQSASRAL